MRYVVAVAAWMSVLSGTVQGAAITDRLPPDGSRNIKNFSLSSSRTFASSGCLFPAREFPVVFNDKGKENKEFALVLVRSCSADEKYRHA